MPIKTHTDTSRHLIVFRITGEVNFDELLVFMKTYNDAFPLMKNCIWDFSGSKGGEVVTSEQLGYFASVMKRYYLETPVIKIGFIVTVNIGFGLENMLSTLEELYDIALDAKIFQSMEEALMWIDINNDKSQIPTL